MRWFSPSSGPFPKRLLFESLGELDDECERLLLHALFRKFDRDFEPPLDDDTLEVLVGEVADLNLFAPLGQKEDGLTDFRPGERPSIMLNEALMSNPLRRKRGRTTLAHEWFHAVYHRDVWELRWAYERARGEPLGKAEACTESSILGAPEEDWMDFQAGHASCAILMPKTWVLREGERLLLNPRLREVELVQHIADTFDVSREAATWRLRHLGLIARLRESKQGKLF